MSEREPTNAGADIDSERLWILVGVVMLGAVAWVKRGVVMSAVMSTLVPYSLATPNVTPFHGDWRRPDVVTDWRPAPGWHVTGTGWLALAVLAVGLVGLPVCVSAAVGWSRWRRNGGVDAVPPVPAAAAAAVIAAAVFLAALVVLPGLVWPGALGAAAAGTAAWAIGAKAAARYRTVAAFAGRADQVLGHGHPAAGRVRVRGWQRSGAGDEYPRRIDAACGPGWQHAPGELAELGRYAREVGWPGYGWTFDPLTKRVTGEAAAN